MASADGDAQFWRTLEVVRRYMIERYAPSDYPRTADNFEVVPYLRTLGELR